MARVLEAFVEPERGCVYLAHERASQDVRVMLDVSVEEYEAFLVRGYRRFGPVYFRPACAACAECVSVRIPTAGFHASKSQRRAARVLGQLAVHVGVPVVDDERLRLYAKWHESREAARGWEPAPTDRRTYFQSFAFPHPVAREVTYRDEAAGGALVGVGLADETPLGWSAVYFFYDPAYARTSVGIANVVMQVEIARQRGIPHVYLGYRVEGCASLAYKGRFAPLEALVGRPALEEEPVWLPVRGA